MPSLFPAFFVKPQKFHFVQQEDDEQIQILLRQHWITNLAWLTLSIIGFAIPFVVMDVIKNNRLADFSQIPQNILSAVLVLWFLGVLTYAVENYLRWYFNIYIVTNRHLVDVNFYNLTNRDITEIRLDDIQSVSSKINGILESLFQFGDVIVESAAEGREITFLSVPKPDFVADRIQDLRAENFPHKGGGV